MLGVGPAPELGGALDYPVNAGKIPVTALPGSSYFDSADAFAMIRGGHVNVAIRLHSRNGWRAEPALNSRGQAPSQRLADTQPAPLRLTTPCGAPDRDSSCGVVRRATYV